MAKSESNPTRNRKTIMTFSECCNNALHKRNHPDMTFCVLPDGSQFYRDRYGNMFDVGEIERQYPTPPILFYNENCDSRNKWFFEG